MLWERGAPACTCSQLQAMDRPHKACHSDRPHWGGGDPGMMPVVCPLFPRAQGPLWAIPGAADTPEGRGAGKRPA